MNEGSDAPLDVLDFILFGIVALGGWNGYRSGLFRQITRLFGAVVAYAISLWLKPYVSPVVASFLHTQESGGTVTGWLGLVVGDMSGAVSFALVFIVTWLLLRYAMGLVDTLFQLPVLSTVNRLAGLVVGLALAVLFIYVATLVAHYVQNPWLHMQLQHSVIVQWLHPSTTPNTLLPSAHL
ncbi:hypothetical protein GCM10025857_32670 [Alicyclobacillus contaminans]|uniref:CvpA family protein n=1 Tax=Alicyclobacillus contaminans TaxID=392016 RepID=UPI0004244BDA|nr:CvpA family protein [Alicyclobacillus contaminans]GMA51910.1 hypothetical protein GCM10025857_32670 [Alicyclobacillus contaminans]